MSRTSISTVLRIVREKNITYESVQSMDDTALYRLSFPEKIAAEMTQDNIRQGV